VGRIQTLIVVVVAVATVGAAGCGGRVAMTSAGDVTAETRSAPPPPAPEPEPEPEAQADPVPGFASCDRRPGEPTCVERGAECAPEQRAAWDDFESSCTAAGHRYVEGPCPREGTVSFGEAGPGCGIVRTWQYASEATGGAP
jgi:hypothetical protein